MSQTSWVPPTAAKEGELVVYNSLTRTKVPFVPNKGKNLTWYNCGPTVYDASHMGHARNYVTQDYLRRILRDYFGHHIHFVMNITDIDDKIIIRARQQHLFDQFASQNANTASSELLPKLKAAFELHYTSTINKFSPFTSSAPSTSSGAGPDSDLSWKALSDKATNDTAFLAECKSKSEKFGMHFTSLSKAYTAIEALEKGSTDIREALENCKDVVMPWLDREQGSTVTDPSVFRALAAYWEASYFKDMEALHVEPPTTLTRVSEYVPEIVTFVEQIVKNGFAYESGGSVYFDTAKFEGAQNQAGEKWQHTYAKLQPWSKGNKELLDEGEGALTKGETKRAAADFALWKASKPGEPQWPSSWGPGRPGWHIECSVMASEVLGTNMDIHSGGIDLQFPHHDNEIAQSEACHDCQQWVNYFFHTGHLHIEGLKMSKSLKNFITIEEALSKSSARQLRLAFLQQLWNARMDFSESAMHEVRTNETVLNNFFANVKALASERAASLFESDGQHHYNEPEKSLMSNLSNAQATFHAALCDSFNTPEAFQTILNLVSSANVYMNSQKRSEINLDVLLAVESWSTKMLRMFGLGEGAEADARGRRVIGWGQAVAEGEAGSEQRDEILMPYLRALSGFRDAVRQIAMDSAPASKILALCDQLRDEQMVDLGVALDDQEDGKALVKLVPAEDLRKAREAKATALAEKAARKAASAAAAEAKKRERLEKGKVTPQEMFRGRLDEFSAFDEEGVPTHDKEGNELSKSKVKNLKKEHGNQAKLHQAYLEEMKTQ